MKNNQKVFVGVVTIGVLVILIGAFGYFAWSRKPTHQDQPTSIPTGWQTFSSNQYGFSFIYPGSWQVGEKISKNGRKYISLSSNIYSEPQLPLVPTEEIQFSVVDKGYFNPPVGTKFGLIGYDAIRQALVDTSSSPSKCLTVSPLLGIPHIPHAPLGFMYDGSLMSDPAHADYALLTQNGNIILVTELTESAPDKDIDTKIVASFNLLNGNNIAPPDCAPRIE